MAYFRVFRQQVGKHDRSSPTVDTGDRIEMDRKAEINQPPHI